MSIGKAGFNPASEKERKTTGRVQTDGGGAKMLIAQMRIIS